MRALAFPSIVVLAISLAAPASAQSPHDPARLFPYEAPIGRMGSPGSFARVAIPGEVLSRTRPDLSDVRIHDARGRDVPYLVGSGLSPWPESPPSSFAVVPVTIERRIEDGESLAPTWREIVRVTPPGDLPAGSRWMVVLGSVRASFVRTLVVRYVDGERRSELARGTVFRLDDPVRERLSIVLAPLPSATTPAPLLELELSGEGGYVEPEISFAETRVPEQVTTLDVRLEERSRESRDGVTYITLARPTGVAPDRIRIVTTSANFHRAVAVSDVSAAYGTSQIGAGAVFRVREIEGGETLEIPVSPASGETLRVAITDGDSPPLDALAIEAVVRQPVLAFEVPEGAATLRFGGGRVRAPRYDLTALPGTQLGGALRELDSPLVSLGEIRPNPRFDAGPALGFAMRPGRTVDLAPFTHLASVRVHGAVEGSSRLRLPASVLAAARTDLADVRVLGADGRQWPYLVAPSEESDRVDARIAPPEESEQGSVYAITLPVSRARIEAIDLHADAAYVARSYTLRGIDDDGRWVELSSGMLSRAPEDASPLVITLSPVRVSRLELIVEDGNDAPLAISRVELAIPSSSLFLAAPDGEYRLVAGDADASAPRYEIARAMDLVLAARAADAEVGEARANPAHVEPPWYERADWSTWLVWAVLLVAVLALGLVTLRLARPSPEPPPPAPAAPTSEEPAKPSAGDDEPPPPSGGASTPPISF